MRVLIMSDMEGVSGIVTWSQVSGGKPLYEEGRRLYTEEINAAVRGAFDGGAHEVIVVDCHGAGDDWTFNSLIPELLDERCEWVAHHPWGAYTEMFERGCDGCLLIGMHARAGTPDGVMCHTISTTRWRDRALTPLLCASAAAWTTPGSTGARPSSRPWAAGFTALAPCWPSAWRSGKSTRPRPGPRSNAITPRFAGANWARLAIRPITACTISGTSSAPMIKLARRAPT